MVKVVGQHVFPIFENEWKVISSRKEIVSLYNCFPLRRGGFELEMSKEANLHQKNCFSYRGSSKYLNSIARSYSLNPVCCVATVCRQVRCMYWGYLGFFHKDISLLSWHKIVYMRNLTCTFICIKYAYMFSMYLKLLVYGHFNFNLICHHGNISAIYRIINNT